MGDTFYLWDEPWTDRDEMNPPQSTEQGCWSQAGRDWAAYVQKWSSQLKAARERGMKVTTPQGKWGPIDRYLDDFFKACNDADGGCDDPTSEGYMDIIGINAFCGAWNTGCSEEGYCCEEAANWACGEIVGKDYDRPVYITNWAALGLLACRDIQYRAMQAAPILLDCPAIDRVYWYSAYMWDDTRFHCEEENYLDKQLASTGTTLGQEWAQICAVYDGNPVSNPLPQTRSEPAPARVQSEAVADAAETCDDVWGNDADGHTCGGRIEWVRDNQGKSLEAAKHQIAHEHPTSCGACGSGHGRNLFWWGESPPSEEELVADAAAAAAAETCDDVWGNDAEGHTCGGRIEWVKNNQGKSLEAAKHQIAHEHPAECGACGTGQAPAQEQAEVSSVGSGTANGETSIVDDPNALCPSTPESVSNLGPKLTIQNTLSHPVDIWVSSRAHFAHHPLPCMTQLAPNGGGTLNLPTHGEFSIFAKSPYIPNKSQFEIYLGNEIFWDISYNAGFDVPMSILSPDGDRHITSTRDSPDAYTFVDRAGNVQENCSQIQPCNANNFMLDGSYISPDSTFQMFLGPVPDPDRPGQTLPDSPGKVGCRPPIGHACDAGVPGCTTSGNNLWCWQAGRGLCASSAEVVCWEGGVKPGTGGCPASC